MKAASKRMAFPPAQTSIIHFPVQFHVAYRPIAICIARSLYSYECWALYRILRDSYYTDSTNTYTITCHQCQQRRYHVSIEYICTCMFATLGIHEDCAKVSYKRQTKRCISREIHQANTINNAIHCSNHTLSRRVNPLMHIRQWQLLHLQPIQSRRRRQTLVH